MGLAVAALKQVVPHVHTNRSSHKLLTYIQQTVNTFTIEHVYRYATLLLGDRVCLRGVRMDIKVSLRVTFISGCVIGGQQGTGSPPCANLGRSPILSHWGISPPSSTGAR